MARPGFGGADQSSTCEPSRECKRLGTIVGLAGRTMQIDIIDAVCGKPGPFKRPIHGDYGTLTLWMRMRHVIGINAFAITQQRELGVRQQVLSCYKCVAATFPNIYSVATMIEWTTQFRRHEPERMETI